MLGGKAWGRLCMAVGGSGPEDSLVCRGWMAGAGGLLKQLCGRRSDDCCLDWSHERVPRLQKAPRVT